MAYFIPRCIAALALTASLVACGSTSPRVNVLGVTNAQSATADGSRVMVMFVEVVNPTASELHLSRLQYEVHSNAWLEGDGEIELARALAPDSSVVVEVPVTLASSRDRAQGTAIPYELRGTLYAHDQEMERAYAVRSDGTLDIRVAEGDPRLRLRIVGSR